jgi:hypothetical protein
MDGLTLYDYLLFPVYLYIITFFFKKLRQRYSNQHHLYLYFTWGFRAKVIIVVVYTLLANFVIRGDAIDLYYSEGKNFAQIIRNNPARIDLLFTSGGKAIDELALPETKGYLAMESNYMVVKVCVLLCYVTFSSFLLINLVIGFIAFLGSWMLYLFFLKKYPDLHKELAIACIGIPTVLFWSANISKDTICLTSLAIFTKCMYDISERRNKRLRNIIFVIIAIYLIYQIKAYIILSYVPFFLLFLINERINATQIPLVRYALKLSIPLMFIAILGYVALNSEQLFKDYSSDKLLDNIAGKQNAFTVQDKGDSGSFFSLGEFDGSMGGLVNLAPKAIVATFFRPFIWESRNLVMLLSAIEATVLLFFTLFVLFKPKGLVNILPAIFNNSIVFYCLAFAIVFAIFVGASTYNFGSLVRYKIPCIPFYVSSLFIINYLRQQRLKNGVMQQETAVKSN